MSDLAIRHYPSNCSVSLDQIFVGRVGFLIQIRITPGIGTSAACIPRATGAVNKAVLEFVPRCLRIGCIASRLCDDRLRWFRTAIQILSRLIAVVDAVGACAACFHLTCPRRLLFLRRRTDIFLFLRLLCHALMIQMTPGLNWKWTDCYDVSLRSRTITSNFGFGKE